MAIVVRATLKMPAVITPFKLENVVLLIIIINVQLQSPLVPRSWQPEWHLAVARLTWLGAETGRVDGTQGALGWEGCLGLLLPLTVCVVTGCSDLQ